MFACLPDVVMDHHQTLKRSVPNISRVRDLGYPIAFIAQNGSERGEIPWDDIDFVFLGGDTRWKVDPQGGGLVCLRAISLGKKVHMGRVNSRARLHLAASWGCTSADGTFLAFGPKVLLPKMLKWRENEMDPIRWSAA